MDRREWLARAGTALGGLLLMAQSSGRIGKGGKGRPKRSTPPSAPGLLTSADLTFVGRFLLPTDGADNLQNFGYSHGAITGRYVGGQLRLIVQGRSHEAAGRDRPLEITYPGYNTSAVLGDLPRASLVQDWGDAHVAKMQLGVDEAIECRGFHWNGSYLLMSYGNNYNTAGHHRPNLVAVANNGVQAYGPWRTSEHTQRTRGYMVGIPSEFADVYLGGRAVGIGCPLVSGAINCNIGAGVMVLPTFDPTTLPPDTVAGTSQSLVTSRLVWHDLTNPQARGGSYKICGWTVPYDCAQGTYVVDGPPNFGNETFLRADSGTIRDKMTAMVWIKNATKEGLLGIAEITKAMPFDTYATDNMPHMRYSTNIQCCHGHVANNNPGTGPNSQTQPLVGYIWNPTALAESAQGLANPWVPWSEEFDLYPIDNRLPQNPSVGSYNIGGAWFDPVTSLLFVSEINAENYTSFFSPRALIHVFQVAGA